MESIGITTLENDKPVARPRDERPHDAGARRHGDRLQSGLKWVRLPPASLREPFFDVQLSQSTNEGDEMNHYRSTWTKRGTPFGSMAPLNSAVLYEEMAAAANFSPYRWLQTDRPVIMFFKAPARFCIGKQAHLQRRLATARADHRHEPNALPLAQHVNRLWV